MRRDPVFLLYKIKRNAKPTKASVRGPLDDTQQEDLLLSILSSDVQELVLGKTLQFMMMFWMLCKSLCAELFKGVMIWYMNSVLSFI